jgi:ParB-like chromosome segregation protein Spo0J
MTQQQLQTPYADLLPPLSTEEFEALRADIERNGVRVPILVDEDGNILDGHNRYRIDPRAPRATIQGLTEAQKRAFVIRTNLARRNLSPTQRKELQKAQRRIAAALREEDPKKRTQSAVAVELGVAQSTVSSWFAKSGTNINSDNTSAPDARVKVAATHKPIIADRVASGESSAQVASDYGVTDRHVRSILTEVKRERELRETREAMARQRTDDCGVICGDFRQGNDEQESADLIFTDPPYTESSVNVYRDLATYAENVLVEGGLNTCRLNIPSCSDYYVVSRTASSHSSG